MNSLRKVLVVDSGQRGSTDPLSVELAELGVSSVTTSFEAADEVLDLIDRPSAIFLKMPQQQQATAYQSFLDLADELRQAERTSGVPVIVWDQALSMSTGAISAILRSEVGPQALSGPEL
jgi:hypothetical protein